MSDMDYGVIINLLPESIQKLVKSQLSLGSLKRKIEELSPQDKKELEKIKRELHLTKDEEVINYLLSGIGKVIVPDDRKLLSQPLMKKIDDLKRISYTKEIKEFKKNCNGTTKDLYTLVIETLHRLWVKRYGKEDAFRRFEIYKEFEKVLFKDPRYRDHFIHQFQVFLSGLPIFEKYYDSIHDTYKEVLGNKIKIDFSWLLAATFHDIGYLVQQFDKWLNSFFKEFLDIPKLPINLDLGRLLLIRNFQDYVDKLSSLHSALCCNNRSNYWKYSGTHIIDNEFRKMLLSKFIEKRNHGIISSLILLDRIENSEVARDTPRYIDTTFSSIVMPSALAIALHDKEVFLNEKIGQIEFNKDPLTFVLIYCDSIQEWGRPMSPIITDSLQYIPHLSNYMIEDKKISATLTYTKVKEIDIGSSNKTTFELKDEEIKNVFSKLKSDDPIFEITLQSTDRKYSIPERTYRSR